ncbi:MAG: alpha/beta fold hydrolase [Euzebyales bacterium]|nr:alpha/beta fold hydrolase [Euzebyales bacterium]
MSQDLWATSRQTSLRVLAHDAPRSASPVVVVLHGLETSVDMLSGSVPGVDPLAALADQGLHVLALDWPGHGRSGGRRGHLTYRLAMEAAATAVDTALDRWPGAPVGLLGTALGGVLAFYAALEDDRVGAAVCHNVLDLRDVRPVLQRWRQATLLPVAARLARGLTFDAQTKVPVPAPAVVADTDLASPQLARALRHHPQAVRTYDLAGLASILLAPEDKPDIAAGRAPTLVAVGSGDRVLPETTTRAFVARLTCPHELWVLPGGGHQLLLEHHRAFVPVAADFLLRHLGAAPPEP